MNPKSNLPERDYYPLDVVAKKLGCEIRDLFHFASRGYLTISLMMPVFVGARISVHGDMTLNLLSDVHLEEIDDKKTVDEVKITNLASMYDVSVSSEYEGALSATIGGLWDLNMGGAEMFECFGFSTTKTIGAIYPTGLDINVSFYAHFESDKAKIKSEYLFVTKDNLSLFCEEEITVHTQNKERPHITEYHSKKRESVLKAAIYMKVNHPELCINNTKWAEAISDHAHKFWETGEPPLAMDTIADLLGKAVSVSK
ncbi:hypothetical protein [Pectobacterium carotovorum]|uniref:hypothetical protein n=1 Tax=Pectobacterium carotovorum TaxID=554 RepID=UPI00211672A9|nr:hypothetical protein [Pectobacterium carotovorum]MCQ8234100.1 hypothetical protein [Pectobacterium carotovorum]